MCNRDNPKSEYTSLDLLTNLSMPHVISPDVCNHAFFTLLAFVSCTFDVPPIPLNHLSPTLSMMNSENSECTNSQYVALWCLEDLLFLPIMPMMTWPNLGW